MKELSSGDKASEEWLTLEHSFTSSRYTATGMKFLATLMALTVVCSLTACGNHVGRINVDGDSTPRFSFVGEEVSGIVVYRPSSEHLNKGIPLDEIRNPGPNTMWMLDGSHKASDAISYGVVPEGIEVKVAAKPLEEGVVYFISGYVSTRETAAFVGQYFKINNGRTHEYHETGDQ